jgi:hypothetical protein
MLWSCGPILWIHEPFHAEDLLVVSPVFPLVKHGAPGRVLAQHIGAPGSVLAQHIGDGCLKT